MADYKVPIITGTELAVGDVLRWDGSDWVNYPDSNYSAGAPHAILDGSTHNDSVADVVTRGSIIYGNSTPKWDELVVGAVDTFIGSDGTDISYRTAAQVLASLSGEAAAAFNLNGQDLTNGGVLFLTEQAAAEADVAGKGQVWVKTGAPNTLWFTDENGTDIQLGVGGAGSSQTCDINGTPTTIYTKYFTGTLDADTITLVAHGITGIDNILSVNVCCYDIVFSNYLSSEAYYGTGAPNAIYVVHFDATNILIESVGSQHQSQKYRIAIDYITP